MITEPTMFDLVEWDAFNFARAVEFWKARGTRLQPGCRALEIGSDYGGLSLWLASEGAVVTCSDRNGPKPEAKVKHREAGFADRVTYRSIDAMDIPYTEAFDVVVMKSVLGIVGEPPTFETQARAIAEVHKALKPGGEFFFAENLSASPLHRALRRGFVKWGGEWRYPTAAEMLEMLKPFSTVEHRTFGFAGTFGRSERQRHLLGRIDEAIFDKLVPTRWNYIIAGVARK